MALFPLEIILPLSVAEFDVIFELLPVETVGLTGKNTSILSTAQPSSTIPSAQKRNLTFTFDCPIAPVKGVTEVIQPLT